LPRPRDRIESSDPGGTRAAHDARPGRAALKRARPRDLVPPVAGFLLACLLGAGALDALPVAVRVALALGILVLLPGYGWRLAIGAPGPGGAWLGAGWALGYGIAWLAIGV